MDDSISVKHMVHTRPPAPRISNGEEHAHKGKQHGHMDGKIRHKPMQ
ncbi:MAG TPA: hypothetical protein HA348_02280 [Thermoplasmata archaeon]|nr:hypothetical protein [Thermoplasmata archaeon]